MRNGNRSGFFGVVLEIGLYEIVRFTANDLDGVFVRAHGAVAAQAIEDGVGHFSCAFRAEAGVPFEIGVSDIVDDAHGKVVLRIILFKLIKDAHHHGWSEFLGGEAEASTGNTRHAVDLTTAESLCIGAKDIFVEWFAIGAGLFTAIEYGDLLSAGRNRSKHLIRGKRPEQSYFQHAHLFALGQ